MSKRLARPLGLTVFDSAWLLTIWCESAQDFRHLRVDRIHHVLVTEKRFRDERGRRFADCLAQEEQNLRQFCGDDSGKLSVNDQPMESVQ
ncbi:hypothetical protein GCM10009092_29500 [Bowmanella denitrificans]|uniref:WYL domain-containing protein n=1 Tax=Bowmanella denitrificans TaxID=366582 RepID=A0ABN0XG93_9ALTE